MSLESSWALEERLKNIECSSELKKERENFINKNHSKCTGERMSIPNVTYRWNLHYIEDNINKKGLIDELHTYNCD